MEWKDILHGPYVFSLVDTVYFFVYALSEGPDACRCVDVFREGDDGYDAWCAVSAIEDARCGDERGTLGSLSLFLGVAPIEAGLCNSAHYRGFCALADRAACQRMSVSMELAISMETGGNAPFAMSLRADLVAWWDLNGLFFWSRKIKYGS